MSSILGSAINIGDVGGAMYLYLFFLNQSRVRRCCHAMAC